MSMPKLNLSPGAGQGAPLAPPGMLFPRGVGGPLFQGTSPEVVAAYNAAAANAPPEADDVELGAEADEGERGSADANRAKGLAVASATAAAVAAATALAAVRPDQPLWQASVRDRHMKMQAQREARDQANALLAQADANRKQVRSALARAAFAARQAAAAAAAAPVDAQGLRRAALDAMSPRTRLEIYNAASENLYPILLLSATDLNADIPGEYYGISLTDFFTKRLSVVCDMVFGSELRKELAHGFTPSGKSADIRKFFEFENPTPQCDAVIGKQTDTTLCWLCRLPLGLTQGHRECEHKLPLILAILLAGLYDKNVRTHLTMTSPERVREYMGLLLYEYGWSHQRCNQIKSDVVLLTPSIAGASKTVSFTSNVGAISALLTTIFTSDKYETSYVPTKAALVTALKGADWKSAVPEVATEIQKLATKLNAKEFTANQLVAHFVRGAINRVVNLAPDLATRYLKDRLSPRQKEIVATRLKGRASGGGRTRRALRRRRTYRRQRGGVEELDPDVLLSDHVFNRTKESLLVEASKSITGAMINDLFEPGPSTQLYVELERYANGTDLIATDILLSPDLFAGMASTDSDDAILDTFDRNIITVFAGVSPNVEVVRGTPRRAAATVEPASLAQTERGSFGPPATPSSSFSPGNGSLEVRAIEFNDAPAVAPVAPVVYGLPRQVSHPGTPTSENEGPKGGFKFTMGKRPNWL
jgi:hypothetical protein